MNTFIGLNFLEITYLSHNDYLLVFYSCAKAYDQKSFFGLEIVLVDDEHDLNKTQPIFTKIWKCLKSENIQYGPNSPFRSSKQILRQKKVLVKFPDDLRFKPNDRYRTYYFQNFAKIRLWMLDSSVYKISKKNNTYYKQANQKIEYLVKLESPYSRESKLKYICLNFVGNILYMIDSKQIYTCDYEEGNFIVNIDFNLLACI